MTTRWTSLKRSSLGLAICALLLFAGKSYAQADLDLTGGADGSAPAAGATESAPQNTAPAAKQTGTARASVVNGKRTSIDFEDELIEGQTQKPELFYLLQKRQFNYKRMIRLRENFLPEMRKTAEEMQRKGSGD